jgi:hypothetical protein
MAYVPPHLRNKQSKQAPRREEPRKQVPNPIIEDNFPVLGNGAPRSSWIGRKFSQLATEWNHEDEKRKEDAENVKTQRHDYTVVLPRFQNIRKFEEPEDIELNAPLSETPDDGWKRVERKKTQSKPKERTFEEYDKEEENHDQNNETVWDVPEHETCWDERY